MGQFSQAEASGFESLKAELQGSIKKGVDFVHSGVYDSCLPCLSPFTLNAASCIFTLMHSTLHNERLAQPGHRCRAKVIMMAASHPHISQTGPSLSAQSGNA